MKISVTGSGGYTGLTESYAIDTANSPALERDSWKDMIEHLQFFSAPATVPGECIGTDMLSWRITVSDGSRQHTVTVTPDGTSETAEWQELINRIKSAQQ